MDMRLALILTRSGRRVGEVAHKRQKLIPTYAIIDLARIDRFYPTGRMWLREKSLRRGGVNLASQIVV